MKLGLVVITSYKLNCSNNLAKLPLLLKKKLHYLSSGVAEGVPLPLPGRHPDADVGDDECDDIAQHVETVRHQGHGVGPVTHDELHQHEAASHAQHAEDLGSGPTGGAAQHSRKLHPQPGLVSPPGNILK